MADQQHIYKILFHNQGQIYEVYARAIYQSDLYGFIEVEDYIFGDKTKVVIDPGQDRLRTEFDGVQRSFIPMHAVDPHRRGRERRRGEDQRRQRRHQHRPLPDADSAQRRQALAR